MAERLIRPVGDLTTGRIRLLAPSLVELRGAELAGEGCPLRALAKHLPLILAPTIV
jgi:hypothetical protein